MKRAGCVAGAWFLGSLGLAGAASPSPTPSPVRHPACSSPKIQVKLGPADLSNLLEANALLKGARLCAKKSKTAGCSVERVLPGSSWEALDLRSGDVLIATNRAPIASIEDVLKALDGISKTAVDCLVVVRGGNMFSIGYEFPNQVAGL